MKYLKALIFTFVLLLSSSFVCQAQEKEKNLPGQTLKHEFEHVDRTTYIQISGSELLTVSNEDGKCLAFISIVNWTENEIKFKRGTTWGVEKVSNEVLIIAFPSNSPWLAPKKVRYEKTEEDPLEDCENIKRNGMKI